MNIEEFKLIVEQIRKMVGISHLPTYIAEDDGNLYAKDMPVLIRFNPISGEYWLKCNSKDTSVFIVFKDFEKNVGCIYQFAMFAKSICHPGW